MRPPWSEDWRSIKAIWMKTSKWPRKGRDTEGSLRNLTTGSWRAQGVERVTLDLGVVDSSPTLGMEITFKK